MVAGLASWGSDGYRERSFAAFESRMPYKANQARHHKILGARYKVDDWAKYDGTLRQRGSLTP